MFSVGLCSSGSFEILVFMVFFYVFSLCPNNFYSTTFKLSIINTIKKLLSQFVFHQNLPENLIVLNLAI
jgi:hypothetical protein